MAGATWSERTAAKVIGYTIPSATFVESIHYFRHALSLNRNVTHTLWLSRAYLKSEKNKNKSQERSLKLLQRAVKMKCITVEDQNAQKEAKVELRRQQTR